MPVSTIACSITDPPAPNASATIIYHGSTGEIRREIAGAQTVTVDLSMIPAGGLQGLRVVVDAVDASNATVTAPVTVAFGRGLVQWGSVPVKPGGFFALASPNDDAGITTLSLATTANAVVHVIAEG